MRAERDISQEELAHRSGLHRNHVGEIERGETNATLDTVDAIAGALGIQPSELVRLAESR